MVYRAYKDSLYFAHTVRYRYMRGDAYAHRRMSPIADSTSVLCVYAHSRIVVQAYYYA
jgi:hypothetical protein